MMTTTGRRLPIFTLVLLLGVAFLAAVKADRVFDGRYGEKMKFAKHVKIEFPDFILDYVGQRMESSEKYPRGFLFYDFAAGSKGVDVKFSWSSGTGDIGPVEFTIDQKRFSLELKRSDKLGPLKEDEFVVWKL